LLILKKEVMASLSTVAEVINNLKSGLFSKILLRKLNKMS